MIVLDNLKLNSLQTKEMLETMKNLKLDKSVLFVTTDLSEEVILSSRNIKGVKVIMPTELNVLDVANFHNMVITEDAVKVVEEVLA